MKLLRSKDGSLDLLVASVSDVWQIGEESEEMSESIRLHLSMKSKSQDLDEFI